MGKGWCDVYRQQTRFLLLWVFTSVPLLVKIHQENASMRVHADGHTDTQTEANWFYNLSRAICYS